MPGVCTYLHYTQTLSKAPRCHTNKKLSSISKTRGVTTPSISWKNARLEQNVHPVVYFQGTRFKTALDILKQTN